MDLVKPAGGFIIAAALMGGVAGAPASDVQSPFLRAGAAVVRVAAWNTEKGLMDTASARDGAFRRLFRALDPDVISLEEVVPSFSDAQIQARLNDLLPLPGGVGWNVWSGISDGNIRNVLASRYPMRMKIQDTIPASDLRGVCAALVDVPDHVSSVDLYVMGLHFKCCSGAEATSRRQKHSDALARWFGDLRLAGGAVDLPANTPLLAIGDFNLVDPDPQQPELTLRTGNIQNEGAYGADVKGDWDGTDLRDLQPADLATGTRGTWPSGTTAPSSRLDRIYFTDSAVTVAKSFVMNSLTLSSTHRQAAGLQGGDCAVASDHLPVVADLALPAAGPVAPATVLNQVQSFAIHSQWEGFQEVLVDFTTSESYLTPYRNASGPVFYTFLQGHWIGGYHYDYAAGRFTQALYSLRSGL